jgi:hypothetical protein
MSWVAALNQFNSQTGGPYTIPKKGSTEYDEVKKLMKPAAPAAAGAEKKGRGRPKKVKEVATVPEVFTAPPAPDVPLKKVVKKKVTAVAPAPVAAPAAAPVAAVKEKKRRVIRRVVEEYLASDSE